MYDVTVIYHANCLDGLFAARACYHSLKEKYAEDKIRFVAANYGDTPPDIVDQMVYIVDFTYPRETLIFMTLCAKQVVVLDHHKTAMKNLEGLEAPNLQVHFDMEKSGCVLARQWFTPHDVPLPPVLKYVQDRDLWRFEYPETEAVCAALYLEDFNHPDAPRGPLDYDIDKLVTVGEVALQQQRKYLDVLTDPTRIQYMNWGKHTGIPVVNSPILQSEIGNKLAKNHPFVVIYYDVQEQRRYSLRSSKDNPEHLDVAELAKVHGGGGHKHAAGFVLPLHRALNLTESLE